jgi:multimeric flavodoxin WrbA
MRMKKILLINGSPKGKSSNTIKLTKSFLKGFNKNNEYEIEEIICSQVDVKDCKGCFYCWKNEEGQCAISDEMNGIFQKYISADIVIWSFPNYFYGMPSGAKRIMDRLLPLYYQNLATNDNCTTYHYRRHRLEDQKYILFCSCGLYNTDKNIDGIKKQFELFYGNKCDMLFCSESQLLSNSFMDYCTAQYLDTLEEEGNKYRSTLKFSSEIKDIFKTPFVSMQDFLSFVDSSSVLKIKNMTEEDYAYEKVQSFFKNMSLTYDATMLNVDNSVLEVQITDYPYTCQLHMNKKKCDFIENANDFVPYRLKVICNLSFFVSNPSLTGATESKAKGPDFNALIDLINKFEKKGITKEMKFC